MRVISNRRLVAFSSEHPEADHPLRVWRKILESGSFESFAALKTAFGSVDKVGSFHVFDIGGNKFRLVAAIHFNRQMLYIRHVFTHREYDRWAP